jgi:hypothetical protein
MATPAAILSILVKTQGATAAAAQLKGLDSSARNAGDGLDRVSDRGKKSSSVMAGVGKAAKIAGPLVGAAGLAAGLKSAVSEFEEAQKVGANTRQVIKSTGGVANVSAKQVENLAGAISKKTGIDDEAIQSGSNLLLTFKNIRNETGRGRDIFNQATKAAVDLSAAGFGSIESTSKQLGKALNDPIKGMTALGRSGVTFSEQQKTAIEALINTGKAADRVKAQQLILREVQSQVGGQAAAQATATDKLKVAFGNLAEAAGSILVPALQVLMGALTTVINQFVEGKGVAAFIIPVFLGFRDAVVAVGSAIIATIGWFQQHQTVAMALGAAVGTLAAIYVGSLIPALVAGTAALAKQVVTWIAINAAMLANPFVLVAVLLAALAAALVVAYRESATFRNIVNAAFNAVKAVASVVFPAIVSIITGAWNTIRTVTTTIWAGIRTVLTTAWEGIRIGAVTAWGLISTAILTPIRAARDAISDIWHSIGTRAASAWDNLRAGVGKFAGDMKDTIVNAFDGAANKVLDFVNAIIGVINKIPGVNIEKIKGFAEGGVNAKGKKAQALARGGVVNRPTVIMGEEAPRHPEYVIPTNPAYRGRAQMLLGQAAGAIGYAEGGVVSAFNRAIDKTNAGPKAELALWMAGIVESGLRNLKLGQGDRDSIGALQIRASTAGPMGINPNDPFVSAMAFLTRGFWGKGSAISLAAANPGWTAGMVAQNTQGSAFPERYDLVRNQALQFFKGKGGGGGIIGAIGGVLGDLMSKGAGFILDQLPGVGGLPDWLHGTGKYVLDKVTGWIKDKISNLIGTAGGGGAVGGGVTGSIRGAMALARSMGLQITSTTGGVHAKNSWHYKGRAADVAGAPAQMAAFFNAALDRYGKHLLELFYDPLGAIKNGKRIGAIGGHSDHVHIALAKGGVFGGPFVGSYAAGGTVPRDGFAQVHAGETITPAGERGPLMYVENQYITEPTYFERELRRLAWAIETA